jgi:hypothetical protein
VPGWIAAIFFNDGFHRLGRDRKAYSHRTARGGVNRGRDADHIAALIERSSARVSLVDRRINLNEVIIGPRADVTSPRGNDTRGYGSAKPVRISDRYNPVANAGLAAIVMGILALTLGGNAPVVLTLSALIVVGTAVVLTGSAATEFVWGVMQPDTSRRTTAYGAAE